ncbi:MAG: hypothetical protein J0L56_05165 [Chitinophagales bacterium]|nr:hypothetical protein [Chitinophagales bacterium]
MKQTKLYFFSITGAFCALLLFSCAKTFEEKITPVTNFSDKSLAQVYIATVSAARNYVYVDGKAVTGTAMSSGSVFPSTGYTFNVSGGIRSFLIRDTLATSTQVPLVFAQNMQVSKQYTIFAYDTITTPKQVTVPANIVIPSDTTARIRFANFVYNPTALTGFDIFSVKRNANVFTNVQVTQVTDFIPYASGVTDTFYIRPTGSPTNLQNYRTSPAGYLDILAILTPTAKRSYTLVFRGGYRSIITTAASVRTLSTFANY